MSTEFVITPELIAVILTSIFGAGGIIATFRARSKHNGVKKNGDGEKEKINIVTIDKDIVNMNGKLDLMLLNDEKQNVRMDGLEQKIDNQIDYCKRITDLNIHNKD